MNEERNIKRMLIEKERAMYLASRTDDAQFMATLLDYIVQLEGIINSRDADIERLEEELYGVK